MCEQLKLFMTEEEARDKAIEGLDDVPIVPNELKEVKRGDVWELGDHRLMCGDSLSPEDLAKLMGNEKADLVFTDTPIWDGKGKRWGAQRQSKRG